MSESLEMKLATGDIILLEGETWLSKIISEMTNSPYNHAACYVTDGIVIESGAKGVQYREISSFNHRNWTAIRNKEITKYQVDKAVEFMEQQEGKKYDYFGLIGIGLHLLGLKKGNSWDDKDRYWCSELVADGYINAGVKTGLPHNTWKTSPGDLAKMPGFEKVRNHIKILK